MRFRLQSDLTGRQTALGPVAVANASVAVRTRFGGGLVEDLDHARAERLISPGRPASPTKPAAVSSGLLISGGAAAGGAVRERGSGRHA